MSPSEPSGWIDRLVAVCLSLFIAALALYAAVQLLRSLCPALLVAAVIVAGVAGAVRWWRSSGMGW